MIFLKEKIYQNDILCVYDSSLCVGMGECLFLFDAFHRDSSCLSLSSLYPQDPPIFQLSSPPIENSELYIYADFRFTIFMTFKICILCINEKNPLYFIESNIENRTNINKWTVLFHSRIVRSAFSAKNPSSSLSLKNLKVQGQTLKKG